jgi:hypothetical protein
MVHPQEPVVVEPSSASESEDISSSSYSSEEGSESSQFDAIGDPVISGTPLPPQPLVFDGSESSEMGDLTSAPSPYKS